MDGGVRVSRARPSRAGSGRAPGDAGPFAGLEAAPPRFGTFARLGEVLALIAVRRPGAFLGFNALALLLVPLTSTALDYGLPAVSGLSQEEIASSLWGDLLVLAVLGLAWTVAAGVMVTAGCDAMAARRLTLAACLGRTLRRLPLVLALGALVLVTVAAGGAALGVLGLWFAAVYSVLLPALLWEGAGWGAMGRSIRLTKEYRWPIAGLIVLVGLGVLALFLLLSLALVTLIPGVAFRPDATAAVFGLVVGAALHLSTAAAFAAVAVVTHARLRAIKEGEGADDLRTIFA